MVTIFCHGFTPFILSPTAEDPTKHELVVEAYVDKLMHGGAFRLEEKGRPISLTWFNMTSSFP
jgi:hypothetical protein